MSENDEPLVVAEPVEQPAGVGVTGTPTVAPAPGSDATQAAPPEPAEGLTYLQRAQAALVQAFSATPTTIELTAEMLDGLTLLVLVKGDRATASDVHDLRMVLTYRRNGPDATVVPFDMLDPREQQGLDTMTQAVQRAGRFVGSDGS